MDEQTHQSDAICQTKGDRSNRYQKALSVNALGQSLFFVWGCVCLAKRCNWAIACQKN
ncbi:hypothetical protein H6F88_29080 [Oculatella sp. FACHB-28]|uniref:hypothetical protein n=1 Tax=Oculatella sp. FACHB-28 TaxID=2692845 RepID=UPI0016886F6B|nr:hypothetical protein [Oculatella sp. FACHB-28]MBD2059999.1 hypothetical protein [Oculatella sp. FACHB-28]